MSFSETNPNSARPILSIGRSPLALAAYRAKIKLPPEASTNAFEDDPPKDIGMVKPDTGVRVKVDTDVAGGLHVQGGAALHRNGGVVPLIVDPGRSEPWTAELRHVHGIVDVNVHPASLALNALESRPKPKMSTRTLSKAATVDVSATQPPEVLSALRSRSEF